MIFIENLFGTLALITSIIGLVPQVWKAAKTKSTSDISMFMLINFLACSLFWVVHGMCQNSTYVVLSNIFGTITCVTLIIQKKIYDGRNFI